MSEAVEMAFQTTENLLVEAGTGVGKSLAYLLPAAVFSLENGIPVVISTETIALQNQLIAKDVPLVSKILGKKVIAEVALGANNYVCKRKLGNVISSGTFPIEMTDHLKPFYEWESETISGIKSEYGGFASNEFWSQVTRDSDNCLGRRCPNFNESFYFLEKEKWNKANILIVNHYLLAAHIAGDFKLLPDFSNLIIDEAHSFPDVLGKSFGLKASYEDISKLISFVGGTERRQGLIHKIQDTALREKCLEIVGNINKSIIVFFNKLYSEVPMSFNAQRIQKKFTLDDGVLEGLLYILADKLDIVKKSYNKESDDMTDKEMILDLEMSVKKLNETGEVLEQFRNNKDKEMVVWVEPPEERKKEQFLKIFMQPMYPEKIIEEKLRPKLENMILTSATLSSGKKDFKFFKSKIGNLEANELILASPFDYAKNCLIYLPKNVRDPATEPDEYHDDISKLIPMLLALTEGNAFVLFTFLNLYRLSTMQLWILLIIPSSQKEMGAEKAKAEFLATDNSVLFGVSTFWQGIDIKGEKLKSVIITKLPFQPPNEPVLEARMEEIKKKNGNPFGEMQLPQAILTLKQGFGRLIRSKTDTGIVSILDPRLQTKNYGKQVLDALPPAKRVYSLKELKLEYKKI
ncbi:MAG: helicase [Leptospiraceae bacterium]|nr:helicase [Leptospiraceae bacterium]